MTDHCISDFGLVEVTPAVAFEAWHRSIPVWKVCNEIARPLWEKGIESPYLAKDYAERFECQSKNDTPYAFWLGAEAA